MMKLIVVFTCSHYTHPVIFFYALSYYTLGLATALKRKGCLKRQPVTLFLLIMIVIV
jgi:hypothetical protein